MSFLTFLRAARPQPQRARVTEETSAPVLDAGAAPVHVLSNGALARVDNGALVVQLAGAAIATMPLERVASLHLHGHASVSGPAVAALAEAGAPVLWRAHNGYPRAAALLPAPAGVAARMAQYDAARDPQRKLAIARALVHGKIVGLRGLLRRRIEDGAPLAKMATLSRKAQQARSLGELLGLEGAASAAYFAIWPELLRHRGEAMPFDGRTRRPPMDPPNALLSYFYAILAGECLCAAAAASLDPRVGFLHEARAGRYSLALDLLELFRAPVADTAALMALNTGELRTHHFETEDARLTSEGRRKAIAALERRLSQHAPADANGEGYSWRTAIEREARRLGRALTRGGAYAPTLRP